MTAAPAVAAAAGESFTGDTGLIMLLGAGAAILAMLGLLLLLPLYITHRRQIERLIDWRDREPDAGTTEFRAVEPTPTGSQRSTGPMTPAQRVTSERPALARITTSEHAAIESEDVPFWRRVVERGPRHPLVLSILALLLAGAVFVAAGLLIRSDADESGGKGGGLDPASVQVVVVNATGSSGVAGDLATNLDADGFDVTGTTAASDSAKRSEVLYAEGAKPAGRAVARSLGLPSPLPFDAEAEAAANGADVVVIAGKDAQATPQSGGKG